VFTVIGPLEIDVADVVPFFGTAGAAARAIVAALGGLDTVGAVAAGAGAAAGMASGAFSLLHATIATNAAAANIVPFIVRISCSFNG